MRSLCSVWWCSNTIFMANTFPKLKKSSSRKISSVLKEEVICVRVHSHGIPRNKYYGTITKRMNFNYPVVETSESIKPNDNDLELKAISYTFPRIFQPELKQLFALPYYLRWSWAPCLRLFGFPSAANEETEKKNTSSFVPGTDRVIRHICIRCIMSLVMFKSLCR